MKRRVTIADIAAEAGVSVPTVSKVLNKHLDVSYETRRHVERIIRERGYSTNRSSKPKQNIQTGLVDLVIAKTLDSDYFLEIIQGLEEVLHAAKKHLVLYTMNNNRFYEQAWLETLAGRETDGVLFIVLPEHYLSYLEKLRFHDIPFMVIDDGVLSFPEMPSVGATNWIGGLTATEYLISLGHRRIATISGDVEYLSTKARIAGFRSAMETAGIAIDPQLVRQGDYGHESGYEVTHRLLELPEPPTAIIASCDRQATGIYRALYERGITIPSEMSVIGFDDIPAAEWLSPPLTTIRQPLKEMGRMAAAMLLRQIAAEPLDTQRVELATSLVTRESCAPPRLNILL